MARTWLALAGFAFFSVYLCQTRNISVVAVARGSQPAQLLAGHYVLPGPAVLGKDLLLERS